MNIKTTLKATVAAAAIFAVAPALAGEVTSGNATLAIGGSVDVGIQHMDNGTSTGGNPEVGSRTAFTDFGSTLRFKASGPINEQLTATGYLRLEPQTNRNDAIDISSTTVDNAAIAIDQINVSFKHSALGSLTIGKQSVASDGTRSSSLGNVDANQEFFSEVVNFVNKATNAVANTNNYDNSKAEADGGDAWAVRYDTPSFEGFKASFSQADQGTGAAALRYGGKFGDVEVAAAAGFRNLAGNTATEDVLIFSAGAKHSSGFSANVVYEVQDAITAGRSDPELWGVAASYEADLTKLGATSFGLGYESHDNGGQNGDELDIWTVKVDQDLNGAASVFAMVQGASFEDSTTVNYEDMYNIILGASVSF